MNIEIHNPLDHQHHITNIKRRLLSLCPQIALKCADVCNPCRDWELSKQWSERVCEEFYRQGESTKISVRKGLSLHPFY